MDIVAIIVSILGTNAATSIVTTWLLRRKVRAESVKIESESESLTALTIKTFQGIYQDLLRDQTVRIARLEVEQAASGTQIVRLEKLVEEQKELIALLRAEIVQLKEQLVSEGHVPKTK